MYFFSLASIITEKCAAAYFSIFFFFFFFRLESDFCLMMESVHSTKCQSCG